MARPIERVAEELREASAAISRYIAMSAEESLSLSEDEAEFYETALERADRLLVEAAGMLGVAAPAGPQFDEHERALLIFALRETGFDV